MEIKNITKDVLKVPQGYYIAHAISGDLDFSGKVATEINNVFNTKSKIQKRYAQLVKGNCYVVDNVFNLVTKPTKDSKLDLKDLNNAIKDMANYCIANGITKIAMPKICTGTDKLDWSAVEFMLKNAFGVSTVNITVCTKPKDLTTPPDTFNEEEFDFANKIGALIIEEEDILDEKINGDIKINQEILEWNEVQDKTKLNIYICNRKDAKTTAYVKLDSDSEGSWFEKVEL